MAVHDKSATHLTSADRRSEILADPVRWLISTATGFRQVRACPFTSAPS